MSVVESSTVSSSPLPVPKPLPTHRPLSRVVMHWVRRGHLYLGLFLFPWAILYGVTAFLFNHPGAFSDQPSTRFGREELRGTPMESPPAAAELAGQVVEELQRRAKPGTNYTLADPSTAKYTRDFAFATVRTDEGDQVSVLVEVNGGGGTVRAQPRRPEVKPAEPAPFAVGGRSAGLGKGQRGAAGKMGGRARGGAGERPASGDLFRLADPLHERVKAAIPVVLERGQFAGGEVTVTSVPDLTFVLDADGDSWNVTYSPMLGTVTGKKAAGDEPRSISVRRFLTRLHLAHGYPSSVGTRWFWALIVDGMAFVMVFWGVSGLFMWWQIKATRPLGVLTLVFSAVVATALTIGMYRVLTG